MVFMSKKAHGLGQARMGGGCQATAKQGSLLACCWTVPVWNEVGDEGKGLYLRPGSRTLNLSLWELALGDFLTPKDPVHSCGRLQDELFIPPTSAKASPVHAAPTTEHILFFFCPSSTKALSSDWFTSECYGTPALGHTLKKVCQFISKNWQSGCFLIQDYDSITGKKNHLFGNYLREPMISFF